MIVLCIRRDAPRYRIDLYQLIFSTSLFASSGLLIDVKIGLYISSRALRFMSWLPGQHMKVALGADSVIFFKTEVCSLIASGEVSPLLAMSPVQKIAFTSFAVFAFSMSEQSASIVLEWSELSVICKSEMCRNLILIIVLYFICMKLRSHHRSFPSRILDWRGRSMI